jgi:hypothetical protein
MDTELKLAKPLVTHKGEISVLKFREPTARSFVKRGEPFKIRLNAEGAAEFDFDSKNTLGFISDMTGIDELILEGLSAQDFWRARQQVAAIMFAGVGGENPTTPSGA